MSFDALVENLEQMEEIIREIYIFTNQIDIIKNLEINENYSVNLNEKELLIKTIISLTNQLKIINNSIPSIVNNIGFFKKLGDGKENVKLGPEDKFTQVKYVVEDKNKQISVTISKEDRKDFLENLSKSNLSTRQLKKKYSLERESPTFGKPNSYAKISNKFFRDSSNSFISKGYFRNLNRDLRKISSPFIVGTYVSMIFFSMVIAFFSSLIILGILLFFNVGINYPFFSLTDEMLLARFVNFFWIIFALPLLTGLIMYFYPSSEAKSLGSKINQELPFVAIHMSAIATSGITPLDIFKIILRGKEYKYTNIEFRKLMNLVNFHGYDFVTALKKASASSPSTKLKSLFDGLSTAITSGGDLHDFLDKHAENLLFDYRLEREKYTKISETFMDIYISVVIAFPMIFLMLFVIMGSTGSLNAFLGLDVNVISILIIFGIAVLNVGFLIFLKMKQPAL